jgi:hypothetical protein
VRGVDPESAVSRSLPARAITGPHLPVRTVKWSLKLATASAEELDDLDYRATAPHIPHRNTPVSATSNLTLVSA